jgi:hypothetical protein
VLLRFSPSCLSRYTRPSLQRCGTPGYLATPPPSNSSRFRDQLNLRDESRGRDYVLSDQLSQDPSDDRLHSTRNNDDRDALYPPDMPNHPSGQLLRRSEPAHTGRKRKGRKAKLRRTYPRPTPLVERQEPRVKSGEGRRMHNASE